jgi:hypothetical protein
MTPPKSHESSITESKDTKMVEMLFKIINDPKRLQTNE